jgi:hypothetical protein
MNTTEQFHQLISELSEADRLYKSGEITREERDYIIAELRDIRAQAELAQEEVYLREFVQACSVAISMV